MMRTTGRDSARAWLQNYRRAEMKMKKALEQLEEFRENVGIRGIDYSRERVQTFGRGDSVAELAVKRVEAERKYIDAVLEAQKVKDEVEGVIRTLEGRKQDVLMYHYIYGMDFVQVADALEKKDGSGYSYGYVYKIHGIALDEVAEKLEKVQKVGKNTKRLRKVKNNSE